MPDTDELAVEAGLPDTDELTVGADDGDGVCVLVSVGQVALVHDVKI